MNEIISAACFVLFIALPPALLGIKFTTNRPNWWLMLAMILGLGWLLIFGTYAFDRLHINALISQNRPLPDGWDSDGASGVVAVFFGWLLSIINFLPWLVAYMLAALIRRFFQERKTPNKGLQIDAAAHRD